MTSIDEATASRFWAKVDKDGPTQPHMTTPCWVWTSATTKSDKLTYGRFSLLGRSWKAHRVSVVLSGGVVDGMIVRHECDNPLCVNPSHLKSGTHYENVHDCIRRGRARAVNTGIAYNAKLKAADVLAIRDAANRGETHSAIASRHGVSVSCVWLAVRRLTWRAL